MSVPESSLSRFSLGRPWQDVVAIGGGLALLNLLTVPSDLGWLSLNPSPWIVLPLLTGARHGFRWGFLSGAVASLLLLGTLLLTQRDMVAAHSLFFLALPALGLLAGEAHSLLAVRVPERETTVEVLTALPALTPQPADPGVGPRVADIAQIQLPPEPPAGPEAEPAPLELQLRGLFEPGTGLVFPNLLRLLQANTGVTDAALYKIEGTSLTRTALLGTDEALPECLPLSETGIAHLAVTRQSLVTCRQVWSTVPAQHSPWLAALPWPVSSGAARYLLLIHRMDGNAVNWRTFSRIQMICRWVAQFMELRQLDGMSEPTAGPLVVTPEIFRRSAADAAAAYREHSLPSTVVAFRLASGSTPEHAARLGTLVAPQMRTTDIATQHPEGTIEVLLTFDGPLEAEHFTQRVLSLASRDALLQGWLVTETKAFALPERAAA
ncbi:MAG: hypothetical protein V4675_06800 [Verrucomicrobiota bacterium]